MTFFRKNMLRFGLCLALMAALLTTAGWSNTQAGEVLDHLPEIQFMRGIAQVVESDAPLLEGDATCTGEETLDAVPNSLWVNELGEIRSEAEAAEVLRFTQCALEGAGPSGEGDPFADGESFLAPFISIISGDAVDIDGVTIDGSKEPIRVGLTFSAVIVISLLQAFGAPLDDPAFLGEDACTALRGFATDGPTFELQWVGFIILASAHLANIEAMDDPDAFGFGDPLACSTPQEGSVDELLAQAQAGNLDAALDLTIAWDRQVGEFFESDAAFDDEAFQAELDRFLLIALENTGWAPLVSLAISIPFISLNVGSSAF